MYCKNCGKEVPEGMAFCANCGTQMQGEDAKSTQTSVDKQPKKKKKWWKVLLAVAGGVIILFILIGMFSGGSSTSKDNKYISFVRSGHPETYPNTAYGDAFDSFFANPTWEYFKGTEGQDVVEFTGKCTYQETEVTTTMQFVLDVENGTFEAGYFDMNGVPQIGLMTDSILTTVFEDYESGKEDHSLDETPVDITGDEESDMAAGSDTQTYSLGETITVGDYELVVSDARESEYEFTDGHHLELEVTLKNIGSDTIRSSTYDFKVQTLDGQLINDDVYMGADAYPTEDLATGDTASGLIQYACAYENGLILHFNPDQNTDICISLDK